MEIVVDEKTSSKEETEKLGIMTGDFVCFDREQQLQRAAISRAVSWMTN